MSVYTLVTESELLGFLAEFDAGELVAFEGISAGIENTNYFVETRCGHFVLTLFEQHSFDQLGYFLKLMAWLSEAGVPTAHPLAARDGHYLRILCGKPAALVQRLRGKTQQEAEVVHCAVLGEALARLHLAGKGFSSSRQNDRDFDWMQSVRERLMAQIDSQTLAWIDAALLLQQEACLEGLPKGVIHADLFLDNALFDGEELTGIIDLYYACDGYWLYDVAVTMNDWCRKADNSLDRKRVNALLNAYAMVRPWTEQEKQQWTLIAKRAALRFFLSRLQDKCIPKTGELTQVKDPEVFRQLHDWLALNCPLLVG